LNQLPSSNAAPSFVHVVDDASSVRSSVHQPPPVFRQQTTKRESIDLTSDHSSVPNSRENAQMFDFLQRQILADMGY